MDEPALIDAYLTGIESLSPVVEGLSPEQLKSYPVPGTWSILEVVCHLADTEALFAERMKRVLAEDRPALLFADPDRHAEALAYPSRNAEEEVSLIALIRHQMTRILRAQPVDSWRRVGVHNREGENIIWFSSEPSARPC
jgi:hypothetical protein